MAIAGSDLARLADSDGADLPFRYRQFVIRTREVARALANYLDIDLASDLRLASDLDLSARTVPFTSIDFASSLAVGLARALPRGLSRGSDSASANARALDRDGALARALASASDRANAYAVDLDRALVRDLARDLDRTRPLARDLDRARNNGFPGEPAGDLTFPAFASWVGLWADVTWIIYVVLGVPYIVVSHPKAVRPVELEQSAVIAYVGAFEGAFAAIGSAGQDGLIDPDYFEAIQNLLQQIELVRQRPSAKTQQLELIVVELLEILNGSIQDEIQFREEFLRLGAAPDTATVAAHELVRAVELAEQHLGTDDPVESGQAMQGVAQVNDDLNAVEESLRKRARDNIVKGAATATGVGAAKGAATLGAKGWTLYGNDFMRIAREVVRGLAKIFEGIF